MDFGWLWCVNVGSSLVKKKKLVSDVDNGGGEACVRAESKWEIFVTSSQFGYESETAPEK